MIFDFDTKYAAVKKKKSMSRDKIKWPVTKRKLDNKNNVVEI